MLLYCLLIALIIFLFFQLISALNAPPQSARRKMMISSWSSPTEPNIYGVLECDVTNALAYVKEIREKTGKHITLTHIVIKAIGLALKETPSVNGKLFFGRFIPYETIDVGCLVAIDGGRDLANAKITNVDKRSVMDIHDILKEKASKLREGKDQDFNKVNQTLQLFPVFILRYIVYLGGFLSTGLGCDIPFLGIRRHPFGACLITSVGMMGLDLAFVPHLPAARVPILVMIGASSKKPIVENDQIVIKEMITITATLDHRFLDGSQAANLAKKTRQVILNPSQFDIDEFSEPVAQDDHLIRKKELEEDNYNIPDKKLEDPIQKREMAADDQKND